jgi:hypothetical protein
LDLRRQQLGWLQQPLANSREPKASSSTRSCDLNQLIDNLDELLLPDLAL